MHDDPRSTQHATRNTQHAGRAWLHNPWLHVAIIVLVAGFFRLWLIGRIPPGLFGDEATDGLDALDVLAGRGAVFFPANYGREGLHMWIVAGMFRLLGVTPLALRLPSAIAGILTAVATYWLGRELWSGIGSMGVAQSEVSLHSHTSTLPRSHTPMRRHNRPTPRRPLRRHLLLARPLQPLRRPRGLYAAVRRAGVRSVLARSESANQRISESTNLIHPYASRITHHVRRPMPGLPSAASSSACPCTSTPPAASIRSSWPAS